MQRLQIKKKLPIFILLVSSIFTVSIAKYLAVQCTDINCVYLFSNGIYQPIVNFVTPLVLIFTSFIFLPTHYFKKWLIWIASWALPISFLLIAQESPYSTGGFLQMAGRPFIAEMTGYIVFGLSVLFIVIYFAFVKFSRGK